MMTEKSDEPITFSGVTFDDGRSVRFAFNQLKARGAYVHAVWFINEAGEDLKFAVSDEAMRALITLYSRASGKGDVAKDFIIEVVKQMNDANLVSSWRLVEPPQDDT